MGTNQNSSGTIVVDHYKRKGFYTMPVHHAHDVYELYYLFTGERNFFIRDRSYRIERGSFVFVEKEELHKTIDAEVPNHERVVIYFNSDLLSSFPIRGHSGVILLPPQEQYRGDALVRDIIAEAKNNAPGRDVMLESQLKQLLLLLFRSQLEQPVNEEETSSVHKVISEIATYVGGHYSDALRLNEVANQFFISPYYLSRKFKECTGFGFSEYVQLVRIREAQRLLRESELKMIQIAEHVGIESVANFYKLFKATNGCSPLQYRKRQQALEVNKSSP
jgi:AraC-like DNA-binding protein